MNLKAISVDDEWAQHEIMKMYCAQTAGIELTATFLDEEEAFRYCQKNAVDLVFLDLHLSSTSGTEFARSLSKDIMIVMVSAYREYQLKAAAASYLGYLTKPVEREYFLRIVSKAQDARRRKNM